MFSMNSKYFKGDYSFNERFSVGATLQCCCATTLQRPVSVRKTVCNIALNFAPRCALFLWQRGRVAHAHARDTQVYHVICKVQWWWQTLSDKVNTRRINRVQHTLALTCNSISTPVATVSSTITNDSNVSDDIKKTLADIGSKLANMERATRRWTASSHSEGARSEVSDRPRDSRGSCSNGSSYRRPISCFCWGGDHKLEDCPEMVCPRCNTKGHIPAKCPKAWAWLLSDPMSGRRDKKYWQLRFK